MILLDTNVIIRLAAAEEPIVKWYMRAFQDQELAVSTITIFELFAFKKLTITEERTLESYLETVRTIYVNASIAKHAARYARDDRLRIGDALIAATASAFNATLATGDKGFKRIAGEIPVLFV